MNPLCAANRALGLGSLTQAAASLFFGVLGIVLLIVLCIGVFFWWRNHCSDVRQRWVASQGLRFVKIDKALASGLTAFSGFRA